MLTGFSETSTLAPATLAALTAFMAEKDGQAQRFEELRTDAAAAHAGRSVSMDDFEEDWNQSQFWYSGATADALAGALVAGAADDAVIALVSAPTVYVKLREWKVRAHPLRARAS